MKKVRLLMMVAMLLASLCAPIRAGELTALVCDLKGKAEVKNQGTWRPLAMLDELEIGDVVRVQADSMLLVSTVERGDQVRLVGPCTAEISDRDIVLVAGGKESLTVRRASSVVGTSAPVGLNLDRMGGVMRPKPGATPRWATDAIVAGPKVVLSWEAPAAFSRFRVELIDEDGSSFVDEKLEGKTELEVFAVPAGRLYGVRFSAWDSQEGEPFIWEGELETLKSEELVRLPVRAESVSELAILLTHQLRNQLFTPALATCRELRGGRPGDKNLIKLLEWLESVIAGRGV